MIKFLVNSLSFFPKKFINWAWGWDLLIPFHLECLSLDLEQGFSKLVESDFIAIIFSFALFLKSIKLWQSNHPFCCEADKKRVSSNKSTSACAVSGDRNAILFLCFSSFFFFFFFLEKIKIFYLIYLLFKWNLYIENKNILCS